VLLWVAFTNKDIITPPFSGADITQIHLGATPWAGCREAGDVDIIVRACFYVEAAKQHIKNRCFFSAIAVIKHIAPMANVNRNSDMRVSVELF